MYFNRFLAILLVSNFMFSVAQSETFPFDGNTFDFRFALQRNLGNLDDERESEEDNNEEWIAAMQNQAPLPPARRQLYQVGDQVFSPQPARVREREDDSDTDFDDGTPLKRPRVADLTFFEAVQRGDLAQILEVANQPGFDVNARNEVQATALHIAAGANLIDVAHLLLELGADPLLLNAIGETPEQKAESYGFAEIAQVLRTQRANHNADML